MFFAIRRKLYLASVVLLAVGFPAGAVVAYSCERFWLAGVYLLAAAYLLLTARRWVARAWR